MNTANDGSEPWTVTGAASTTARIRVTSVNSQSVSDVSDADFIIDLLTIILTAPNGGENWVIGTQQMITWSSSNLQHELNLDLNRDYPNGQWERIDTFFVNSGQIGWIVTGPASTNCRFRVSSYFLPQVADTSDADFTISSPASITVLQPNGGEIW